MKAIEKYFHVLLSTVLYKVALNYKFMNQTLLFDHSNER